MPRAKFRGNHTKGTEHIMRLAIAAFATLLAFSAVLLAQMDPEEAQQRLQERIAQEQIQAQADAVAATQPSDLTNGQVADLKKTISRLENENSQLKDQVQQLQDKLA